MSIPDGLILSYFEVYTSVPLEELEPLRKSEGEPMAWKLRLAGEIVARYHGPQAAAQERDWFLSTFSRKKAPADATRVRLERPTPLLELLRRQLPQHSVSELRRLIEQGAVRINGSKITRPNQVISVSGEATVKVGKLTWFRLVQD